MTSLSVKPRYFAHGIVVTGRMRTAWSPLANDAVAQEDEAVVHMRDMGLRHINADKTYTGRELEGARRSTAMPVNESPHGTVSPKPAVSLRPDPEVAAKPTRRRFTAENKLRILQLADACTTVGSLGALLRTEGLYASNLTTWRRQRTDGVLSALTPQKRGRKASAQHPLRAENETLRTENARLTTRLKQAELIIDVQKKVSQILGIPLETPEEGGRT